MESFGRQWIGSCGRFGRRKSRQTPLGVRSPCKRFHSDEVSNASCGHCTVARPGLHGRTDLPCAGASRIILRTSKRRSRRRSNEPAAGSPLQGIVPTGSDRCRTTPPTDEAPVLRRGDQGRGRPVQTRQLILGRARRPRAPGHGEDLRTGFASFHGHSVVGAGDPGDHDLPRGVPSLRRRRQRIGSALPANNPAPCATNR